MFWKRKKKHKTLDERAVRNLLFKLPGADNGMIIPAPGILGVELMWGFIPYKKQPKSIAEILLEKLLEEKRKAQQ
ncbi:hypothetical protein [Chitinophaga pinensis]|uniref:Uncharacterized protein n=1 Tax=Chitinophaga pinensis TaxID=79329 RepID=A0A5C6LPN6_9BACT|nr:hypothetical protein [Chitinophaga pinensis]TWV98831.1 hypothetical protein FEF09_19890 [Chitinophaga pinensis]